MERGKDEKNLVFISVWFLFSLFIFSSFTLAQEFDTTIKKVDLSLNISSVIHSEAEKIIVNLTLFPRATENCIVDLTTKPLADIEDEFIIFNFNKTGALSYMVESRVNNEFILKKIMAVSLPLDVPAELEVYTKATEYVVIDSYIKNKAFQLVAQDKDAFETLYNVAEYVRINMNYSLENQELRDASWIMQEKKGVCSHYTILFMAMARALGIPARFVSGVAYSNKDKAIREHAWAEVWIGEWVPFDLTFGQYGWLDSSHVVLKKSLDAGTSVEYEYIGNITLENLTIKTEIINSDGLVNIPFEMKLFSYADRVGFNSYVPIEVSVKNPYDYYISVPIYVSLATGVFRESEKVLFLKPKSETKSFFIIYIPDSSELEECGKECLAKFEVKDKFGNSAMTEVLISINNPRLSLQEAENITRIYKKEETIDFYCKSDKEFYYNYENIRVLCQARSPKDVSVSVCNHDICKNLTLKANELQNINLELPVNVVRNDSVDSLEMTCMILCIVTREIKDVVAVSCIDMKLLMTPEVTIATLQNTEAKYGSRGSLSIIVESNIATDANLSIFTDNYSRSRIIFLKKGTNIITVDMATWKMAVGDNKVKVKISYKDKNERIYESSKDFIFTIKDVNILEKLFVKVAHLFD